MSITHDLNRWHMLAANVLLLRRRPQIFVALLFIAAVIAVPWLFNRRGVCGCVTTYLTVLAAALVFLVVLYLVIVLMSVFAYRRKDGVLDTHTIELLPTGIRETTHLNESLHRWATIQDIFVDGPVILFVLGLRMHVIPRSAFPDKQSADEFVHLARRYMAATTGPQGVDVRLNARVW